MVKISPFQALRPTTSLVDKVITKTYSNYSRNEINKEIKNNKYSFLNIINSDPKKNTEKRFDIVRSKINNFKKRNIFIKEKTSGFYIYRQSKGSKKYTGLVCNVQLKDYQEKKIKIHEKTIKNREVLFAEYLTATRIHAEPVLITYNSNNSFIKKEYLKNKNKLYDFRDKDEIQHEIWCIEKTQEIDYIISKFKDIDSLYIADGHHRMASSLRCKKSETCLAYILPKNELATYPFHRILKTEKIGLNILQSMKKTLATKVIQKPNLKAKKLQYYINGKWYEINHTKRKQTNNLNQLLVTQLLNSVLKPIFNIHNERDTQNIRFIPGDGNITTFEQQVNKNEILFLMETIEIERIISIANDNQTTPPKSTFILPKIPSGLIMMEF